MTRFSALVALVVAAAAAPSARANTILQLSGFPTDYTPGTPFSFEVKFGGTTGPGSLLDYTITLAITSDSPLDLSASVSKPTDLSTFVFQNNLSTLVPTLTTTATQLTLKLEGSQLPDGGPVQAYDVELGVNDVFGVVTITPSATLTGPITLAFEAELAELNGRGGEPVSFGIGESVTLQQNDPPTSAVPTPASWLVMGIGSLTLLTAARRTRRMQVA